MTTNGYMVSVIDSGPGALSENFTRAFNADARDDARRLAILALERHTDRLREFYGLVEGGKTVALTERQDMSGYDVVSLPYETDKSYETLTTITITKI